MNYDSTYPCTQHKEPVLTGMTRIFLSCRILSAGSVVGPLAPSTTTCRYIKYKFQQNNAYIVTTRLFCVFMYLNYHLTIWQCTHLGFHMPCNISSNLLLFCCWYKDVTWSQQEVFISGCSSREPYDGFVFLQSSDMIIDDNALS